MTKEQSKRFWTLTTVVTVLSLLVVAGAFVLKARTGSAAEPKFGIDLRILAGGGYVLFLVAALIAFALGERVVRWFCCIAFWEGVSYLALLFIAMPLKYGADMPLAVKYTGWAHGALFIAYVLLLVGCWLRLGWSAKRVIGFFIASLLPFVPFWVEIRLKRELSQSGQFSNSVLR